MDRVLDCGIHKLKNEIKFTNTIQMKPKIKNFGVSNDKRQMVNKNTIQYTLDQLLRLTGFLVRPHTCDHSKNKPLCNLVISCNLAN